jgi:hypothetical protein
MRKVLLLAGMSAVVLAAVTWSAAAKQATLARYAMANSEIARPVHFSYAKHWKRGHRAARVSRRSIRPHGYAIYRGGAYRSYETDLLLDCLLSQPFVICP